MNQQEILNFVATLDHQLLIAVLVLLCLLFLFWRMMTRTARLEREVHRLGERLASLREETRAARAGALSVAPLASELSAEDTTEADEPIYYHQPAADLTEEDDVLQRAVVSLEGEKADAAEESGEDPDTFAVGEPGEDFSLRDQDRFVPEPTEETSAFEEETPATEDAAEEKPAATDDTGAAAAELSKESSGVARLERDPARPDVGLVRCLSCNYKLAYPDKLSGKRVRCPSCRASLTLP